MGKKVSGKRNKPGLGAVGVIVRDVGTDAVTAPVGGGEAEAGPSADANLGAPIGARFPIVGIGASAGGLEALTQLLTDLAADTGMSFVLIQHLDPTHKSLLSEVLGKATQMPVSQAEHGQRVEPNQVYVIPPNADVAIQQGLLTLVSRTNDSPKLHLPVDFFFAALAADLGNHAIGVVLSGTGSDGTEGLKAIKAEGGITFVQDPKTARFAGMPQSAVAAGVVDYVLPISDLAKELVRLSRHPYVTAAASRASRAASRMPPPQNGDNAAHKTNSTHGKKDRRDDSKADETVVGEIMNIVKAVVGVDFRQYKVPTFERRLGRRIALRRVEDQTHYLDLLKRDPDEVRVLCEETLIHVSSFFRDPEVFETLKAAVFPEILKHKAEGAPIRIWAAGCSTGQEVYSLALCLLEFLGDSPQPHPIQIFGSDVSEQAIQTARAGRYTDGAMSGVSEERRRRYFTKIETGYRINKSVRDLCVFVRHDLARDPHLVPRHSDCDRLELG